MHHPLKLDVFIIRAFALLSENGVVSSNLMTSVSSSPQTSTTTPSNLSTTNLPANTGSSGKNEIYNENESNESKNGTPNNNSSHSGSTPTAGAFVNSGLVNTQFMRLFLRISKLYNATLNTGSIDDRSTSPKSSIELYQRFQQIIKELGLSYEASPYAKYFRKINDETWKVKSDEELTNDNFWNLATLSILNVYDPDSGQMIVQSRGKKSQNFNQNNKRNDQSNSTPNSSNDNDNNNESNSLKKQQFDGEQNVGTRQRRRNVRLPKQNKVAKNRGNQNINSQTTINDDVKNMFLGTNQNNVGDANSNLNNMLFDSYLQQQLQKRLQSVPHDINSRSLNGYYTQPTSPGVNNFEFGFGNDLANAIQNGSTPTLPFLNTVSSNTTNPMAAALNNNNVNGMNNGNNIATSQHGNHNWKRRSLGSLDVNTLDDDTVEELLQLPNVSQKKQKFSNEGEKQAPESAGNDDSNEYNEDSNSNNNTNMRMQSENGVEFDSIVKQMKDMYESIVNEKGQRIVQLERELELQRQETQWLRKMLIEDMGCVRSMLKDLQR
ncbi:Glycolytic genes transcriptional activator GCR2 [Nakaseomyces bracarensis]|uniref:Glycolytic genes transcriptional activator GCR2 n=1 Tax=Nakaseomyces bracarensis TaxID=273131 RepID=A0ABR4NUM0_9SACH